MSKNNKQEISYKIYWKLLVEYLRPQSRPVLFLSGLLVLNIALQLLNPQVVRIFLNAAETQSGIDRLFGAAILFMVIALLNQAVKLAATYVGENVAWRATNNLRADLALHCLKLDITFHKRYKPGELIERVDGDINQLANFFSQLVMRLLVNLLLAAGVLILLTILDWRLGIWIAIVAALGMLAIRWLTERTIPRWQAVRESDAGLFGFIEEWLNSTEDIRTSAAEPYIMRRLYQALRDRWQKILAAMRIQVLVADLPLGVFALAYSGAHVVGTFLFNDGHMTIGDIYLIFYYLEMLQGPLWEILRQIEDLQRAAASINRITELRLEQPTLLDGPGASIPKGPLAVQFNQVFFHYEDDQETQVLQEIDFYLRPGAKLGLLGRTGSGKSTLTKLIYRFYDPTQGEIRIGANESPDNAHMIDIRQATKSQLRHHIGVVTQDVQLFQASVKDNLTLFTNTVSDSRVLEVIHEVGLDAWFENLPNGLDTVLESGSGGMSAGEAQLLAFGRVLLSDPGLVILDEASSRLDKATESNVERAIDRLLANRTGIIIAHRLSTVGRADEIMILNGGSIAEHGPRTDLANDSSSIFYGLLETGLEEAMAV